MHALFRGAVFMLTPPETLDCGGVLGFSVRQKTVHRIFFLPDTGRQAADNMDPEIITGKFLI